MSAPWKPRTAACLCGVLLATAAAAAPRFRIDVRDDGVYGVRYEDLAAGLSGAVESERLALSNRGVPVPIWVADGGDGRFGPGDRLEFVGRHLPGTVSYYDRHSPANAYVLDLGDAPPAGPVRLRTPAGKAAAGATAMLVARQHLEQDNLLLRYPSQGDAAEGALWYWAKLTHIDPEPLRVTLDLSDLGAGERPVEIRLQLRGWSRPSFKPDFASPDHRVEVQLDGRPIGYGEWNNDDGPFELRLPALASAQLAAGPHELALTVPKRSGNAGDSLVDVAVLDWIELAYPRQARLEKDQDRLELESAPASLRLAAPGRSRVALYGDDGTRLEGRRQSPGVFTFGPLESAGFEVVADARLRSPLTIVLDAPSALGGDGHRADYLMITTAALRSAVEPLAEFRRRQGLAVEIVDIQDVFDEFHHGIPHPVALRDFIAHAHARWQRPAPRFVLLVGDASWDTSENPEDSRYPDAAFNPGHGTAFADIDSSSYPPERRAHRDLIPAWTYGTSDGHAAGDNWFVAVAGGDDKPELAIGRLPVTTPEEVAAIVAKTIAYETAAPLGAWRRNLLWISNEDAYFQSMSDRLAAGVAEQGYAAERFYAEAGVTQSEAEQAAIREAIDRGPLLVHFVGHGGRFIWRTGPPDWTKHRDLFNLDDIGRLTPNVRLPVVLAMTCYSAPFDHPTADSIGEKFLREPGRGAVAVVAASWRNAPHFEMSQTLVDELLRAPTVGEALQAAKRATPSREFIEQYNLLGDPALRLQRPQRALDLARTGPAPGPAISATLDGGFSGHAVVDWLDAAGATVDSDDVTVAGPRFTAAFQGAKAQAASIVAVRVYAWDARTGIDAAGELRFQDPPGAGVSRGE